MSLATKIMLSKLEQAKVMDADWILTKHQIMQKAQLLMQQQINPIIDTFKFLPLTLDANILGAIPKISKGENYKKLPYIILDYPAVFAKQDVFALRTLFWWGHNFSVHFLLSGKYFEKYKEAIFKNVKQNPGLFYVCVNKLPWEHHFEPDNYILANVEILEKLKAEEPTFLKMALKFNLEEWNSLPQLLPEAYQKILRLLLD